MPFEPTLNISRRHKARVDRARVLVADAIKPVPEWSRFWLSVVRPIELQFLSQSHTIWTSSGCYFFRNIIDRSMLSRFLVGDTIYVRKSSCFTWRPGDKLHAFYHTWVKRNSSEVGSVYIFLLLLTCYANLACRWRHNTAWSDAFC